MFQRFVVAFFAFTSCTVENKQESRECGGRQASKAHGLEPTRSAAPAQAAS